MFYHKKRSKIEVANDIYEELVNLHLTIKKRPQSLRYYLNQMLISRDVFSLLKNKKLEARNDIERAAFYYYRTALSFASAGDNFAMPKKKANKNIYKSFNLWHNRLKGVCIENMDFAKLIANYDAPDTLFYADPPYLGTEDYYAGSQNGGFSKNDHERLRNSLKSVKGKFVLSYNAHDAIKELYKGFNIKEIAVTYGINAPRQIKTKEFIIKNF